MALRWRQSYLRGMTVLERVKSLLAKIAPNAVCDDCMARDLAITPRQHANHKTRELARLPAFERKQGTCAMCKGHKKVIRYA